MTDRSAILSKFLTYAGILPFAIFALGVVLAANDPLDIYASLLATALLIYAIAIFTFFSGIRWGVGVAQKPPETVNMFAAATEFGIGWILFLGGFSPVYQQGMGWPLLCFAGLFVLHHVWDRQTKKVPQVPDWFFKQRFIATVAAAASLTVAGFALILSS